MTNNYTYSIKINEALERYGAKTTGTLERRVERLKRFTDMKNKQYAADIHVADARMVANQEREDRMRNRVREIEQYGTGYKTSDPMVVRLQNGVNKLSEIVQRMAISRNLASSFEQVAEVPMTPQRYNLRPRQ